MTTAETLPEVTMHEDRPEAIVRCFWSTDGMESFWETQCGHAFEFNDGGPTDNGFVFCPYCGKPLAD